jgi:hypothetical protein
MPEIARGSDSGFSFRREAVFRGDMLPNLSGEGEGSAGEGFRGRTGLVRWSQP